MDVICLEPGPSNGGRVQLRVYPENPAMALYARLGFEVEYVKDEIVHMRFPLTPGLRDGGT